MYLEVTYRFHNPCLPLLFPAVFGGKLCFYLSHNICETAWRLSGIYNNCKFSYDANGTNIKKSHHGLSRILPAHIQVSHNTSVSFVADNINIVNRF